MTGSVPEVSVAMPARNAAPYIGAAIASILAQDDITLELIVVDDGSEDGTADVVEAVGDPRVRLIRNGRRRGIGYSHNAALARSTAPVVAHVDADDIVLPGALRKLVDAVARTPAVGQSYCHHFPIDDHATDPVVDPAWRALLSAQRRPPIDHRRGLLLHGMIVNHLRTYRRDVFDTVGPFNERLPYAVDYEMALRIAERYDFALVPEFLYGKRIHSAAVTEGMRCKALRFWWSRLRICRRLMRAQGNAILGRGPAGCYAIMAMGLLYATGLPRLAGAVRRALLGPRS